VKHFAWLSSAWARRAMRLNADRVNAELQTARVLFGVPPSGGPERRKLPRTA